MSNIISVKSCDYANKRVPAVDTSFSINILLEFSFIVVAGVSDVISPNISNNSFSMDAFVAGFGLVDIAGEMITLDSNSAKNSSNSSIFD